MAVLITATDSRDWRSLNSPAQGEVICYTAGRPFCLLGWGGAKAASEPHPMTPQWLQDSTAWLTSSKHHISHVQLHHQEESFRSPTAWTFCDLQPVQKWAETIRVEGRDLQVSALPKSWLHLAGAEQQQPQEQWEPKRPCLPPGCPRGAQGGWCRASPAVRWFPPSVQTAPATREFLLQRWGQGVKGAGCFCKHG